MTRHDRELTERLIAALHANTKAQHQLMTALSDLQGSVTNLETAATAAITALGSAGQGSTGGASDADLFALKGRVDKVAAALNSAVTPNSSGGVSVTGSANQGSGASSGTIVGA